MRSEFTAVYKIFHVFFPVELSMAMCLLLRDPFSPISIVEMVELICMLRVIELFGKLMAVYCVTFMFKECVFIC